MMWHGALKCARWARQKTRIAAGSALLPSLRVTKAQRVSRQSGSGRATADRLPRILGMRYLPPQRGVIGGMSANRYPRPAISGGRALGLAGAAGRPGGGTQIGFSSRQPLGRHANKESATCANISPLSDSDWR
jgi:hypothetical protein